MVNQQNVVNPPVKAGITLVELAESHSFHRPDPKRRYSREQAAREVSNIEALLRNMGTTVPYLAPASRRELVAILEGWKRLAEPAALTADLVLKREKCLSILNEFVIARFDMGRWCEFHQVESPDGARVSTSEEALHEAKRIEEVLTLDEDKAAMQYELTPDVKRVRTELPGWLRPKLEGWGRAWRAIARKYEMEFTSVSRKGPSAEERKRKADKAEASRILRTAMQSSRGNKK